MKRIQSALVELADAAEWTELGGVLIRRMDHGEFQ